MIPEGFSCKIGVNIREGECLLESTVERVLKINRKVFKKGLIHLVETANDLRKEDPESNHLRIYDLYKGLRGDVKGILVRCKHCKCTWFVWITGKIEKAYLSTHRH